MVLVSLAVVGTAGGAIYVDATATAGAKDGTSWEDAYIYIQDALAEAITERHVPTYQRSRNLRRFPPRRRSME